MASPDAITEARRFNVLTWQYPCRRSGLVMSFSIFSDAVGASSTVMSRLIPHPTYECLRVPKLLVI